MPDYIGNIQVPEITPSGEFPLIPDFPLEMRRDHQVVVHQFGSGNAKIEQRFLLGTGARRFTIRKHWLRDSERIALRNFWESKYGPYGAFTYNAPNDDGQGTTQYVCRFANEPLSWEMVADWACSLGVTLIEIPQTSPSYPLNQTVNRFPPAALQTALLSQVQEIIPLVKIQPLQAGYPAIYVSDRRCTVGGQLYQARLIEFDGISQSIGNESDQARFLFGNADRVMRDLANDVDLFRAEIGLSLYHVGTGIKLDLWKGNIIDWSYDDGAEFSVTAADGLYELNLPYPTRKISRTCWKEFKGPVCPYSGPHTSCDKGFDTPNGCRSHGMDSYFGGIVAKPQGVRIKDNSTGVWGFGRSMLTSVSLVADSIYDQVVPEIYTDSLMPVNAKIAMGREESDFYAAVGIVGEGPIGAYGTGHKLDGQYHHGYPGNLGLMTSTGEDPNPTPFGFDTDNPAERAAGTAFIMIRRSDAKGLQLSRLSEHSMEAVVAQGLGGWVWTAPGARAWQAALTNPIWIAVNMLLRARGLRFASAATCEQYFDVEAAIAAAVICDQQVSKLIGSGYETQFKFRGIIQEEKPLRDWLQEVLMNCLGYYTFANGKLKLGVRVNSSAVEAFTEGNILFRSLQLAPLKPAFNHLTANFADEDFEFVANSISLYDIDHATLIGGGAGPLFLKSTVNLAGTASKSQAARIITTRLREELGGITASEWKAARVINFRTTVLALNTEPGMVCSMTHPDMPGGSGEFRVTGWRLNRDYSIDILGRTTTDSMYDLMAGPKPADVVPDPVTVEAEDPVPGDVRPINGQAFVIDELGREQDSNGVYQIVVPVRYDPPDPIGLFTGVRVWLEDQAGDVQHAADFDYNGNPEASGEGRYGSLALRLPPPPATETWRIYLASRSRAYVKPLVRHTAAPDDYETPNRTVGLDPIAPGAPQAVTCEVIYATKGNLETFGLRAAVTPAQDPGATQAYAIEARYYRDAQGQQPDSDWIALGSVPAGASPLTLVTDTWPMPDYHAWVQTRAAAVGMGGDLSDWIYSALAGIVQSQGPAAPSNVTLAVLDQEGNFGLQSSWQTVSGAESYEVQGRYYSMSGQPESDWIVLGWASESPLISGYWPRPDHDQQVRVRVAARDVWGRQSEWAESGLVTVETLALPPAPAAVSLSIAYDTDGTVALFGLNLAITPAPDPGTTEWYVVDVRYYLDAGCTQPDSDWIPIGGVDPAKLTLETSRWPLPTYETWVVARVAGQNARGAIGPWAQSAAVYRTPANQMPASVGAISDVSYEHDVERATTRFRFRVSPPSPLASYRGVHIYIEAPDQSGASRLAADGSVAWDGSRGAVGDIAPIDAGRYAYDQSQPNAYISCSVPILTEAMRVRIVAASYSDVAEIPYSSAPSVTLDVAAPVSGKPLSATAWSKMAVFGSPAYSSTIDDSTGVRRRSIRFNVVEPTDAAYAGWEIWSYGWPGDTGTYLHTGLIRGADTIVIVDEPTTECQVEFRLVTSGLDAGGVVRRNPYVPGITPAVSLTLGSPQGTVSPVAMRQDQIGPGLEITPDTIQAKIGPAMQTVDNAITVKLGPALQVLQDAINLKLGPAMQVLQDALTVKLGSALDVIADAIQVRTGGIVASMIESVNANQITGLIVASQIQSINANQIAGLIAATQIQSINANQIAGLIAATQIQSINANQITGLIVASQIQSINANQIAGLIAATQIQSINANQIAGSIQAGQIASITAGQITGTIIGSQIGSLQILNTHIKDLEITGGKIANLTIDDTKIANLSVSKLLAGSITCSGDITFSNTGNLILANGGYVYINPGYLYGTGASFKSAGYGWEIIPGWSPEIRHVNAQGRIVCGYVEASSYVIVGSQLRVGTYYASGSPTSPATHRIPVYDSSGNLLNYLYLYP